MGPRADRALWIGAANAVAAINARQKPPSRASPMMLRDKGTKALSKSSSASFRVRRPRPRKYPGPPGTPLRGLGIAARPPAAPHSSECRSLPHTCHRRTCRSRARRRSRRQERVRRRARGGQDLPVAAGRRPPSMDAGAYRRFSLTEGVDAQLPLFRRGCNLLHAERHTVRYIWIGLLLLLSGCASYTPQPPLTHGRATPRSVTIDACGDGSA
jgi:hypothetical protein